MVLTFSPVGKTKYVVLLHTSSASLCVVIICESQWLTGSQARGTEPSCVTQIQYYKLHAVRACLRVVRGAYVDCGFANTLLRVFPKDVDRHGSVEINHADDAVETPGSVNVTTPIPCSLRVEVDCMILTIPS